MNGAPNAHFSHTTAACHHITHPRRPGMTALAIAGTYAVQILAAVAAVYVLWLAVSEADQ